MAESEGYWSKHHTGIIQCASGLYCAAFATWEHFNPRTPPAANTANGHAAGALMIPRYAMPFWLWAGIVALALSVAIPAIVGIFRRRKLLLQKSAEPVKYDGSGGALNLKITDTLSIKPVSAETLLTRLQIDALVLACDLRHLSREMGPIPHPNWKEPKGRWGPSDARAENDIREWNTAFSARYKNQFSGRAVALFRKVAEMGIENPHAEQYAADLLDGVDKVEQVKGLAAALTFMVAQIENKK